MQNQTLTAEDIELNIDKEFRDLIPAATKEQREDLAKSVDKYGKFLDPIRYWSDGNTNLIIDGHRRFELWCGLPDDTPVPPPIVQEMYFADRSAAMEWMLFYQLGRRNLTPAQASILRGQMYQQRKGQKGGSRPDSGPKNAQNTGNNSKGHFVPLNRDSHKIAREVAAETGVNEKTIRRDAAFVEALDAIGQVNSKARADIQSGDLKLSKQEVQSIGKLDPDSIGKAIGNVRSGRNWQDDGTAEPSSTQADREENRALLIAARSLITKAVRKCDEVDGFATEREKAIALLQAPITHLDAWTKAI